MDENIEYYFNLLQENIGIVEDDEENREALDAVTVNFRAVFEYIKMFLIANKERYYGYFLMDMELKIDYYYDADAGVNMDTLPFTLYVNPLLLGRRSIKEMIFIICHEIEHIVLEHPAEGKKINRDFDEWQHVALNFAMDASVNDRLKMEIDKYKMSLMSFPEDGIDSSYISDEYNVDLSKLQDFLYYYDKIATFEGQVVENVEFADVKEAKDQLDKETDLDLDSKDKSSEESEEDYDETDDSENPEDDNEDELEDSDDEDPDENDSKSDEKAEDDDIEDDEDEAKDEKNGVSGDSDGMSLEEWYDKLTSGSSNLADAMGPEDEHFWDDTDDLIGEAKKKKHSKHGKKKGQKPSGKVIFVLGSMRPTRIITAKNRPPGKSLHKWTQMDLPDEIREQLLQYIQQVVDGIPEETRGLFPSHQQEALNRALEKPRIKWENVLRKYIGTIPNGYRKTRTRLDRRQPERFDISGKISKRTIDIVVAIDTSGSMSRGLLQMIFTEIFSILKSKEFHLTIIECDAEIQLVYEAKRLEDVKLEVKGRGGTSFRPVIEYVNNNKKFRKSLLIYFTDGMGDNHIPYPLVYRMLWVLPYMTDRIAGSFIRPEQTLLSVQEPYGDVITMNAYDDFWHPGTLAPRNV